MELEVTQNLKSNRLEFSVPSADFFKKFANQTKVKRL